VLRSTLEARSRALCSAPGAAQSSLARKGWDRIAKKVRSAVGAARRSRRFALGNFGRRRRVSEKRRQSRRTLKVLGARFGRDSSLLNRGEFFLHVCRGANLKIWLNGFGDLEGFFVVCAGFVAAALGGECVA